MTLVHGTGIYSDRPPDRWEWEVAMSGRFFPCKVDILMGAPPTTTTCYLSPSVVYVDYYTGQIVLGSQP